MIVANANLYSLRNIININVIKFKELTNCPVIANTSFNVRGKPIVCTPEDAFRFFMSTGLDLLVIGNCILKKQEQDETLRIDYKDKFALD